MKVISKASTALVESLDNLDIELKSIDPNKRIAIGFSGGGDSAALAHIFMQLHAQSLMPSPILLTVDHLLREQSTIEAASCAEQATSWGLQHHILTWEEGRNFKQEPSGNLQDAARNARREIMINWCEKNNVPQLLFAHNKDDQVETFLMRLQRGSGVDGLAGIHPIRKFGKVNIIRPLLMVTRAQLREYLLANSQSWIDDPSNKNTSFARIRVRNLLNEQSDEVINRRIARSTKQLQLALPVLNAAAEKLVQQTCSVSEHCVIVIDIEKWEEAEQETQLRALARLLCDMTNKNYRPRFKQLDKLHQLINQPNTITTNIFGVMISKKLASDSRPVLLLWPEYRSKKTNKITDQQAAKKDKIYHKVSEDCFVRLPPKTQIDSSKFNIPQWLEQKPIIKTIIQN